MNYDFWHGFVGGWIAANFIITIAIVGCLWKGTLRFSEPLRRRR
jgi:hypothetical protein